MARKKFDFRFGYNPTQNYHFTTYLNHHIKVTLGCSQELNTSTNYDLPAVTALVKSPEWMVRKRATDADGKPTEETWIVFYMFDRGPLISCSLTGALLCIGSIVSWSLALVHDYSE